MSTSRKKVQRETQRDHQQTQQTQQQQKSTKPRGSNLAENTQMQPSFHDVFDAPSERAEMLPVETKASAPSRADARRKKSPVEPQTERAMPHPAHKDELNKSDARADSSFNVMQFSQSSQNTQSSQTPQDATSPFKPDMLLSYSFIYFIRLLDNTKSDESTYKIGYSNDVPAYRKQLEANMPQNVKTMRVLHCKKNDADKISAQLCESIKQRELRSSWFRIKKEELDNIVNTLVTQHQCEVVSESKAVVKPPKKSRKPSN